MIALRVNAQIGLKKFSALWHKIFQKIAETRGSASGWRPQTPKHPIRPNKSGGGSPASCPMHREKLHFGKNGQRSAKFDRFSARIIL